MRAMEHEGALIPRIYLTRLPGPVTLSLIKGSRGEGGPFHGF